VASVLVYINTSAGRPERHSLEVLGEGRRIASTLGATLYAYAEVEEAKENCSDLIADLGQGGVDRVLVRPQQSTEGPALWSTRGQRMTEAAVQVHPQVVILAADDCSHDVGPRLAAELGGAFIAEPAVHYGSHGEVIFSRLVYGSTHHKRLNTEDSPVPIVITLTSGSYPPADGVDDAEAFFFDAGAVPEEQSFDLIDSATDEDSRLEHAAIVVVAGAGLSSDEIELARELSESLGGEFGATHSVCEAGHVDSSREVDVSARRISPQLYIACGASGSAGHLGAVSSDAEIIAINTDARAPIFRVASYGVVGKAEEILPQLISAAKENK
jgi:electron transfer flavoprotein alpha subunit